MTQWTFKRVESSTGTGKKTKQNRNLLVGSKTRIIKVPSNKVSAVPKPLNSVDWQLLSAIRQERRGQFITVQLASHSNSFPSLQELKNLIPKSAVGTLSANSSNVINLIIDAYNVSSLESLVQLDHIRARWVNCPIKKKKKVSIRNFPWWCSARLLCVTCDQTAYIYIFLFSLVFYFIYFFVWQSLSSEVILENSKLPDGMTLAYTSRCKNGVVSEGENGRKCSNISIGDEVSIAAMICATAWKIGLHSTQVRILQSYMSYFAKQIGATKTVWGEGWLLVLFQMPAVLN